MYGYDVSIGGGYRGVLIGKMLRVGLMTNFDNRIVYEFDNENKTAVGGALYKFLHNFSSSHGIDLIQKEVKSSTSDMQHLDTFGACINHLVRNEMDVCLGKYVSTLVFLNL